MCPVQPKWERFCMWAALVLCAITGVACLLGQLSGSGRAPVDHEAANEAQECGP